MARATELAPAALGCREAVLCVGGGGAGKQLGYTSAQDELISASTHEFAVSCIDGESTQFAAVLDGGLAPGTTSTTGSTAIACYLPNGGGRRPAALICWFDTRVSDGRVAECEGYAELVDTLIAHQHADDQVASLRAALDSNREIGTAMGILMATRHISGEQAFGLLREASQRTHRKLNTIAAEVVYTGLLAD